MPRGVPATARAGRGGAPVVVCAPNAFKGTLTAAAAATALAAGVVDAGWRPVLVPMADGGDGTLDVLLAAAGPAARVQRVTCRGPLGGRRRARLGWIGPRVAVVEMAEACGLRLMPRGRFDPMGATSRGAGELVLAALESGAERIIVGVGGSASTDGGAGILVALGASLLDDRGRPVPPGGAGLSRIAAVEVSGVDTRLAGCRLEVAVDVRSPLTGPTGAAHVFAPQKGAAPGQVEELDSGLRRLAALLEQATGRPGLSGLPGAGAAGGAAFALAALGAELVGGAGLVADEAGLDSALRGAALVITGEGRLDDQTLAGKAPAEVARRARRAGLPCIAVGGTVSGGRALFEATIALDALGDDPLRHARALLRVAGRRAVEVADGPDPAAQP